MNILFVIPFLLACGHSTSFPTDTSLSEANRIVNGQAIDISEIPYHASLRRKSSTGWTITCGAAIITIRALLTAAHCIPSIQVDLRVTVGTSSRLSGGDDYDVQSVYVHEQYSYITLQHDIALLVTSTQIKFDDTVDAVSIPEPTFNLPVGTAALVSGYGMISQEGPVSSILMAATVEIVDQDSCTVAYRQIAKVSEGMLCASNNNPPRDACQGDSGGPLVTGGNIVGIVSWGEGCANMSYPGVYTRVSEYYSWIINKLVLI